MAPRAVSAAPRFVATAALVGLLAMAACSSKTSASAGLDGGVSLTSARFTVGQPMTAKFTLTNTTKKAILVNKRMAVNDDQAPAQYRELSLDIRSSSGARAPFRVDIRIGEPAASDVTSLAQGASVSASVDMNTYYVIDTPGDYTVQVTYTSQQPGSAKAMVVSPKAPFTVS